MVDMAFRSIEDRAADTGDSLRAAGAKCFFLFGDQPAADMHYALRLRTWIQHVTPTEVSASRPAIFVLVNNGEATPPIVEQFNHDMKDAVTRNDTPTLMLIEQGQYELEPFAVEVFVDVRTAQDAADVPLRIG